MGVKNLFWRVKENVLEFQKLLNCQVTFISLDVIQQSLSPEHRPYLPNQIEVESIIKMFYVSFTRIVYENWIFLELYNIYTNIIIKLKPDMRISANPGHFDKIEGLKNCWHNNI